MKKKWGMGGLLLILLGAGLLCGCAKEKAENPRYGVFIGANPQQSDSFTGYDVIVIDAAYYTQAELDRLHQDGATVYSYLNVGSLEDFRAFYPDYQHLILDEYDNWPGEYWVDITSPAWQSHIQEQAELLVEKGIDGFFIDNADVYYQYPDPGIFQSLVTILAQLGRFDKDIIMNGGDVFIAEAILEPASPLVEITGVNQECVFTDIDFDTGRLTRQDADTTRYYQAYLELCQRNGLTVYLLEYGADKTLLREMEEYCDKRQFGFYVSPSIDLP